MDGHCISECLAEHLLIQLLINITVIFVKKPLKNLTISIYVILETNLVKKTLNFLNIYGNWKRKLLINLLIMILLWNYRSMFVIPEGGIYAFVRRFLFTEHMQFQLSHSVNVITLFQNAGIEINLVWSVLKIDKIIFIILCM